MASRIDLLQSGLTKQDRIIEIGPSFNPVAPKSAGWASTVVDHGTREELVEKYRLEQGVDASRIEDVDVIWSSGLLETMFPEQKLGSYRAIIASHVLEHLPDPITFLQSAQKLLDPVHGALRLAVPDKRLCFDVFRPNSTTGKMLAAHKSKATAHSYADLFDHAAYLVLKDGAGGWTKGRIHGLAFAHEPALGVQNAENGTANNAPYLDCHAWLFTPASFERILLELHALGFIEWTVEWIKPQNTVEFLVSMKRSPNTSRQPLELQTRRMQLMLEESEEVAELAANLSGKPSILARLKTLLQRLGPA